MEGENKSSQPLIHYGLVEEAIHRKMEILNRSHKRPAEREYKKIVEVIYATEMKFHQNLFSDRYDGYSYKDIYEFYQNQYNNNVEYIAMKIKPKYWKLDKAAFSRKFRPLED